MSTDPALLWTAKPPARRQPQPGELLFEFVRASDGVPVRQWVLSLPHRLRYLLAWDHELCRAVTGVALRTVLGFLPSAHD